MVNYASATSKINKVLVVGTLEKLQEQTSTSNFLFETLKASDVAQSLLQHAVGSLTPGTDSGATASLLLPRNQETPLHVSLHALPTQVSRGNSSARPHAIASFVKNNKALAKNASGNASGDEKVLIVLSLPQHTTTWFAAGCAVAKASFLYDHKQKLSSGLPTESSEQEVKEKDDRLDVVYEEQLQEAEKNLLHHTARGIQLAARLVDAPPNEMHSDAFVAEAQRVAKRTGAKITVIRGEELREQGFGGIYGVGKAAVHPPALIVLSHVPENASNGGVAMVGKGIIYDTGGLSIKTGGFMVGMKRDMGGAAGLLGAFEAAVQSKNSTDKRPLHAVLCMAENSIDALSTRPDDIHIMYSGKTVEINNTDAEGRLVLADGVAYAVKNLSPEVIVDMATLTGAQGIATGKDIGAVYTNNEELEGFAVKAGKDSGDLVHPMPYVPEFFRKEFKSTVADMKNSVKDRLNGQVSCAGQFIANHLGDEFEQNGKWIHVDMAFPSFTGDDERSTGFGVAFMQSLLKQIDGAGW